MIRTMKQTTKTMSNLSLDIEIVNPIESKSLFGGCDYCGNDYHNMGGGGDYGGGFTTITSGSSENGGWINYAVNETGGGFLDYTDSNNHILNGGYSSDWNNPNGYGNNNIDWNTNNTTELTDPNFVDANGDGINDADMQQIYDLYPGDLSAPEALWLYMHPTYVSAMYSNQQLAFSLASGHNGVSDALRHALWSALDAFDIGSENAHEFHTLHETTHYDINYPNRDVELMSDLHNNGWGYNWAIVNGNPEANMSQFLSDFNAAVVNGHIDIVPIP